MSPFYGPGRMPEFDPPSVNSFRKGIQGIGIRQDDRCWLSVEIIDCREKRKGVRPARTIIVGAKVVIIFRRRANIGKNLHYFAGKRSRLRNFSRLRENENPPGRSRTGCLRKSEACQFPYPGFWMSLPLARSISSLGSGSTVRLSVGAIEVPLACTTVRPLRQ